MIRYTEEEEKKKKKKIWPL